MIDRLSNATLPQRWCGSEEYEVPHYRFIHLCKTEVLPTDMYLHKINDTLGAAGAEWRGQRIHIHDTITPRLQVQDVAVFFFF